MQVYLRSCQKAGKKGQGCGMLMVLFLFRRSFG